MEARILCLRTPYPSIRKLQCLLTGRNSNLHHRQGHRHHNLALTFSPPFDSGLRVRPCRRLHPVIWAHKPPPLEGDSSNRKVDGSRSRQRGAAARSAAAAAAVVLACAIGAMCPSWKGRACALTWLLSSPPQVTSDPGSTQAPVQVPHQESIQERSVKVLWEIFRRRSEVGVQKPAPAPAILLDILREQVVVHKLSQDYLSRLKTSEKGDAATNSLFKEWVNKGKSPDTVDLGLLLIDVLINQGDYEKADFVCQNIESYAPESDVRPQIRRVIIDVMQLTDVIGSAVKETEKTKMLKRKMDATMLKLIGLIKATYEKSPSGNEPHVT